MEAPVAVETANQRTQMCDGAPLWLRSRTRHPTLDFLCRLLATLEEGEIGEAEGVVEIFLTLTFKHPQHEGEDVFANSKPSRMNGPFLQSVYLGPQILKRRRYDAGFLEMGSDEYRRFDEILDVAHRQAQAQKHRLNISITREFLSKTATDRTIERLGQNEG